VKCVTFVSETLTRYR